MKLRVKLLLLLPLIGLPLLLMGCLINERLTTSLSPNHFDQAETLLNQVSLMVNAEWATAEANLELYSRSELLKQYLLADEEDRFGLWQRPLLELFSGYVKIYPVPAHRGLSMAGVTLDLDVDDKDLRKYPQRLDQRLGDLAPVFTDMGEHLLISHADRWTDEETPGGDSWAALDPDYEARKDKKRPNAGILTFDGFLQDLAYNADADGLDFGTNRIQGATHQFGDDDRGIPQREWLGISDDDREELLEIAREWLEEA